VIADDDFAYVTLKARTSTSPCWGPPPMQTNELNVIDVKNISSPVLVKVYNMAGPTGLSKDGNLLFICDGIAGLKVYDATDPANLILRKTIIGITPQDVIAINGIAMVVAKEGIYQYEYNSSFEVKKISYLPIAIR
jgi:hypothetical protein